MAINQWLANLLRSEWGIHPANDRKRPAADNPLRRMPLPEKLYLPLQQHLGAPARPVVLVGQRVLKGQVLAEAQGNISAAIHAPTSGTVAAVGEITAPHASGLPVLAITLQADGRDEWGPLDPVANPFALSPDEIARRVAAAGIVGLGGATFPSALKLNVSRRAKIHTLIANGGECEPYLSCDDRLMRDEAVAIVEGLRLMQIATGAGEIKIGIEENKPEAIAALRLAVRDQRAISVHELPARYPMGSEKQLIQHLAGIEVPADGRPADVGVLVHNVGTALAVARAVREGKPLISRVLTINGGAVAAPGNIEVPLGVLVEEVLAFAGGLRSNPARLVMGGPMMGVQLPHSRVPVVKGSSGILALTAEEVGERLSGPCVRCSSCIDACPMGLLPLEMAARIRTGDLDGAVQLGLKDCISCGCCAWVCPSRIPLVQYFVHAKGDLAGRERDRLRQEATRKMAAARIERLEREAREKAEAAARRKADRARQKAAEAAAAAAEPNPTVHSAREESIT